MDIGLTCIGGYTSKRIPSCELLMVYNSLLT